jgi:branched-subunit amino acid aminotransferase/4-amino-4-deoxychorismate lyase
VTRAARLIETVRIRDGAAPLWYLHVRRLAVSCKALGIPLPRELLTPAGGEDRVYRLEVGAGGIEITERSVGSALPINLVLVRAPHHPYPHKTTDRAQFDVALAEARAAGADDALLRASGVGYVAEAAIWSVFWWEDRQLCAPPLDLGILPGVARARLAELMPIAERRVTVGGLAGRPLFVANAVRGVVPVATLDGEPVPSSPATNALASRFWRAFGA